MTMPVWLLWLIVAEEACLLTAFVYHRQWVDVVYWIGVMFINGALLVRAYQS
jgi:hypothetical protein